MKLKKMPLSATSLLPDASDVRPSPEQEAEWLRHKHLGASHEETFGQKPLMGLGGKGRKTKSKDHHHHEKPEADEEDERYWAQMINHNGAQKRMLKGGHGVPLSGKWLQLRNSHFSLATADRSLQTT